MPWERPARDSVFTKPVVIAGALNRWAKRAAQQTVVRKILLRAQTGAQESVCLALPPPDCPARYAPTVGIPDWGNNLDSHRHFLTGDQVMVVRPAAGCHCATTGRS